MPNSDAVLHTLAEIEEEMRRIRFWDDSLDCEAVRRRAIESATTQRRSPVGLMPFEHWLQAVFIPNASMAAHSGQLPVSSEVSVLAMREYDYHSRVAHAQRLLELLTEFDALF